MRNIFNSWISFSLTQNFDKKVPLRLTVKNLQKVRLFPILELHNTVPFGDLLVVHNLMFDSAAAS